MNAQIICAIISVFGAIFSALISCLVSRSTANKEIQRLKLSWEREDVVTSDDEFSDMTATVARCIAETSDGYAFDIGEVVAKVASVRAKESGTLAALLDGLYAAVRKKDADQIDELLSKVIEEKRQRKSKQHRTGT